MGIRKDTKDLLLEIADYRVVSTSQIAHLRYRSGRAARKRLESLRAEGYLDVLPGHAEKGGGRPENLFTTGRRGFELLLSNSMLPTDTPFERVGGESLLRELPHQLLLNWVRVHLTLACRHIPEIDFDFLAANSPLSREPGEGRSVVAGTVPVPNSNETVELVPDGVFILRHEQSSSCALFFLEVDTGSEPLTRADGTVSHIHEKVERYKAYFRSERYKKLGTRWNTNLTGFRTLFLTPDKSRARQLSKFLRGMQPCEFCWVSSREDMEDHGISGEIWMPGGETDASASDSVLDAHCRSLPLPLMAS